MSSVSQVLNLMHYVEVKRRLSFNVTLLIWLLVFIVLTSITAVQYFQYEQLLVQHKKSNSQFQVYTQEMKQLVIQHSQEDYLLGILPDNMVLDNKGFYQEFDAFTRFKVKELWVRSIHIADYGRFIRLEGITLQSHNVNALLKALAQQAAFSSVSFEGINVKKGEIPAIAFEKRKELLKIKIPTFYQYVIQTTPLNED